MNLFGIIEWVALFTLVLVLVKPLGLYIAKAMAGEKVFLTPVLKWPERVFYKLCGVAPDDEMNWQRYSISLLVMNFVLLVFSLIALVCYRRYVLMSGGEAPSTAELVMTAVSYLTNTNWQILNNDFVAVWVQKFVLSLLNFTSAATGITVVMVMVRGFSRRNTSNIGNFWVDFVRVNLYVLLPLALLFSVLLLSQGVVQSYNNEFSAETAQAIGVAKHGPAASVVAIKQLGTNGGGYYAANSSHTFENPTPFSSFISILAIILLPASLTFTYGYMAGDARQGWSLFVAMSVLMLPLLVFAYANEGADLQLLDKLAAEQGMKVAHSGNMAGKEQRFGAAQSTLWTVLATTTSNGSNNASFTQMTPLGGAAAISGILLGEIAFGGAGSGLYGILVYLILAVFICSLMIGRSPEYIGKKLGVFEVKLASFVMVVPPILVLIGTSVAFQDAGLMASLVNKGTHGFSEIFYNISSLSNNNGSAFSGVDCQDGGMVCDNNFAILASVLMLCGRFFIMIPVITIAGSLAQRNRSAPNKGTLETHTPLFIFILTVVVLFVGELCYGYAPGIFLGPVADYFTYTDMLGE